MTTLPIDNTFEDPTKRAPLVLGHTSFDTVTAQVARVAETPRPPLAWYITMAISLGLLSLLGAMIGYLIATGVGVWGNQNPVMWGFPIVNFVFWVGIGHAGTLISAILFLFRQKWRTSINRFAEAMTMAYHTYHGVDTRIVRIFNTYGPRMRPGDGRVVSNFIVQALKGEDITLYGDGQQTRSFCYVDDLVDGLVRMMESPDGVTGPINLGNPGEFTIRELAETVIDLTGSRSNMVNKPLPQDDPRQRQPDITRAKTELGWEPTIALRDGLEKTIAYFDQLLTDRR